MSHLNDIEGLHADAVASKTSTSTAAHFLSHLSSLGIRYFYVNGGTDTAPIVEAYASAGHNHRFPQPVVAAHESVAVGMAYGYYLLSGEPQAVMVHVTVGTANALCGLMNAARGQVPILMMAGRTPLFEEHELGARDSEIHWGQEMFDQASMVREVVKWDYELRGPSNMGLVLDRALSIAMTAPRGPVYVSLPREVLAAPAIEPPQRSHYTPASGPAPDPASVKRLAQQIIHAKTPVIVSTASGADASTVASLAALCTKFGIGVAEVRPRYVNVPSTHPYHIGYQRKDIFEFADCLLFLEASVPWIPLRESPRHDCFIAQAGEDVMFDRYPLRTQRSDLMISCSAASLIAALADELDALGGAAHAKERSARLVDYAQAVRDRRAKQREQDNTRTAITKLYLTACLDEVLPAQALVFNEYSLVREHLSLDEPGQYFMHPDVSGLGWCFPAALGAKQAAPDRPVVAVMGDGTYLLSNPAACHHAASQHQLPIIVIVFNNAGWNAVYQSTESMYPTGAAHGHAAPPLCSLGVTPQFEQYAEASGGVGIRVTQRKELKTAIEYALKVSMSEQRQVIVNVIGQA